MRISYPTFVHAFIWPLQAGTRHYLGPPYKDIVISALLVLVDDLVVLLLTCELIIVRLSIVFIDWHSAFHVCFIFGHLVLWQLNMKMKGFHVIPLGIILESIYAIVQ